MKKIIRVFPRRTKASPTDSLSRFDVPGMFDEADEVHVSVCFTWDIERAEWLAEQWRGVAPVRIGGPAYNQPGAAFVPGMYIRRGYTITSRGCPNRCWYCSVWKREPCLREFAICDGTNVQDDNLLACSERHIVTVFDMLKRQRGRVEFTGGLEAKRLESWHVHLLALLRPAQMFFALDTPDDEEPLRNASKLLLAAGFSRSVMRCYVLIGYPRDTFDQADARLRLCVELGFYPCAMLWRNTEGTTSPEWRAFQRLWARPAIIAARLKTGNVPQENIECVQNQRTTPALCNAKSTKDF
jgi:hypothetical protein